MKSFLMSVVILLLSLQNGFSQLSQEVFKANNHPSLLINKSDESRIKMAVAASTELTIIQNKIFEESNRIMDKPTLSYVKEGRRLLDVSRECLKRVFYLSYSYRMTGEVKYAQRAEQELLAVSDFSDWNPSHFLDVAEMTMAVSIGYDWLYEFLPEASRQKLSDAIIEKGLRPSNDSKDAWFLTAKNNWNQVCNAGMLFGAIAIREKDPELAKSIAERSLKSLPLSMTQYEPEGTYDEGYMYWGYGTTFNVMLISAAEKFFGKELFPLDKMPGFVKSASYMLHMVGPVQKSFNYSDCMNNVILNPAVFWFANRTNNPGLLYNDLKLIKADNNALVRERLLPAVLIWSSGLNLSKTQVPKSNFFIGKGTNPVCMMRSSWSDSNAVYIAVKAGSPSAGHGHMDVGSFVVDALGERWASDFGMQDYNSLESKGIKLFDMKQNSGRWKVFRYTNLTHNTLAFNDSLQRVNGKADFTSFANEKNNLTCSTDLSDVYASQVKSAKRTVTLKDDSYVKIKDEITALSATKVRWTMLTEAIPEINQSKGEITLTKNGKKLILRVDANSKFTLETWNTQSPNSYDAPNPGTTLVGFESELTPNQNATYNVSLIPQKK